MSFEKKDVLDQLVAIQTQAGEAHHDVQVGFKLELGVEGVEDRDQGDFGLAALPGQIAHDPAAKGSKIGKKLAVQAQDLPITIRDGEDEAAIRYLGQVVDHLLLEAEGLEVATGGAGARLAGVVDSSCLAVDR